MKTLLVLLVMGMATMESEAMPAGRGGPSRRPQESASGNGAGTPGRGDQTWDKKWDRDPEAPGASGDDWGKSADSGKNKKPGGSGDHDAIPPLDLIAEIRTTGTGAGASTPRKSSEPNERQNNNKKRTGSGKKELGIFLDGDGGLTTNPNHKHQDLQSLDGLKRVPSSGQPGSRRGSTGRQPK